MKLVSVVVPCYNEEEVLPMFYEEITKVNIPTGVPLVYTFDDAMKVVSKR